MNWTKFKQRLYRLWVVETKQTIAYLSVTGMLNNSYDRHWDEYPWYVTETIRFRCLSEITDYYLVEQIVSRKEYLRTGELKVEVIQRSNWKASMTKSHVLLELGEKDRMIGFIPEKRLLIFEENEYTEV